VKPSQTAPEAADTTGGTTAGIAAQETDPGRRATQENWLFPRLAPWVIDTLSSEQKEAIHQAATDATWNRPPVNVRLRLPFFGRRYYLTVVGGEERRSLERRAHERHHYPLRTMANAFFFLGVLTLFYLLSLVGMAFTSAIIEF